MSIAHARRCTKIKHNGEQCKGAAVSGRDVCRAHGGRVAIGIASVHYGQLKPGSTHLPGQRSKYIPLQLAADYRKAQKDPDKLSMAHEIAIWAAREQELLKRVQPHDPGALWHEVASAWSTIMDAKTHLDLAQHQKDLFAMKHAYARFNDALATGAKAINAAMQDHGLWSDIHKAHHMLLQLRSQEHKRLMDLQRYWSAEDVAMRWGQFLHALWEACQATLPKEAIRPLLQDFQHRMRSLDEEFRQMRAVTQEPDISPEYTPVTP